MLLLSAKNLIQYKEYPWKVMEGLYKCDQERCIMANKEQKKVQKAAPKSNKQKKEAQKEKKAAKTDKSSLS
jgi:hypothetical protein